MKIRKGDVYLSTGKGYVDDGKYSGEVFVVVSTHHMVGRKRFVEVARVDAAAHGKHLSVNPLAVTCAYHWKSFTRKQLIDNVGDDQW